MVTGSVSDLPHVGQNTTNQNRAVESIPALVSCSRVRSTTDSPCCCVALFGTRKLFGCSFWSIQNAIPCSTWRSTAMRSCFCVLRDLCKAPMTQNDGIWSVRRVWFTEDYLLDEYESLEWSVERYKWINIYIYIRPGVSICRHIRDYEINKTWKTL